MSPVKGIGTGELQELRELRQAGIAEGGVG